MSLLTAAALLAATTVTSPPSNPNSWKEVNRSDGVVVWTRDVPGSSIREAKAETIINAPLDKVIETIEDVEHYSDFMPYVVTARIVASVGTDTVFEYQLVDPPLVNRRDYTLKVNIERDPEKGVYHRSWVPANDQGPAPRRGVVRVQICRGSWTVSRLSPGTTRVVYWVYTDPGGSIPNWIANRANSKSLPALMNAVRQRSVNPGWTRG